MSLIQEPISSIHHRRPTAPVKPLPQIPTKCPPLPPPRRPSKEIEVSPRDDKKVFLQHQQPLSEFLEEIKVIKNSEAATKPRRHSYHQNDSNQSENLIEQEPTCPRSFSVGVTNLTQGNDGPQSPRGSDETILSPRSRNKSILERGLQKLASGPRSLKRGKLQKKNTDDEAIMLAMQFIEEKTQTEGELSPRANLTQSINSKIFGVPVERVVELGNEDSRALGIPLIMYRCVERLRPHIQEEGIFRLSGAHTRIQYWKSRYDSGEDPCLDEESDPNVISGLLKLYLREVPDSLLTGPMIAHFEASTQITNPQAQTMYIHSLLQKLPQVNLSTLFYILGFFVEIAGHSASNLMNVQNLSLILSPALRCSAGVVQIMLDNFDWFYQQFF